MNSTSNDWNKYFSTDKASDVAGSDIDSMTQLLRSLSYAGESEVANQHKDLYNAIDEYFR